NRKILSGWGWSLAAGIAELLIGILLIARMDFTMVMLALFVGFAILFRSIMATVWSFELKRMEVSNWGGMLILGILGIVLALILLSYPIVDLLSVVVYTSAAFVVIGIFQVYLAIKLGRLSMN